MLAIDPRLPHGEDQEILLYRKSMNKFPSSHSALEICEATKPSMLLRSMTLLNFKHPSVISKSGAGTLNKRNELASACRHTTKYLIKHA